MQDLYSTKCFSSLLHENADHHDDHPSPLTKTQVTAPSQITPTPPLVIPADSASTSNADAPTMKEEAAK